MANEEFYEHQDQVMETWANHRIFNDNLTHALEGLVVESAELLQVWMKERFKLGQNPNLSEDLLDELADVYYYFLVACHFAVVTPTELVQQLKKKLEGGYGWKDM